MNEKKTKKQKLLQKKETLIKQIEAKQQQVNEITKDLENLEQLEIKNLLIEKNISFEELQKLINGASLHK